MNKNNAARIVRFNALADALIAVFYADALAAGRVGGPASAEAARIYSRAVKAVIRCDRA